MHSKKIIFKSQLRVKSTSWQLDFFQGKAISRLLLPLWSSPDIESFYFRMKELEIVTGCSQEGGPK